MTKPSDDALRLARIKIILTDPDERLSALDLAWAFKLMEDGLKKRSRIESLAKGQVF